MTPSKFLLAALSAAPLWTLTWAVTSVTPARAQTGVDLHPDVHSITAVSGTLSVVHNGSADSSSAAAGAQLRAGDRLITGANSRADIQLDSDNLLAAGPNTEFRIVQLANFGYQLELIHGELTYRMLSAYAADAKVETPNVSVRPGRVGAYRITVTRGGESEIVPETSDIEVVASSGSQWVGPGWKMIVRGPAANPEFKVVSAVSWWKRAGALISTLQLGSSVVGALTSAPSDAKRGSLRQERAHVPQPAPRPHEPGPARRHESAAASSHAAATASSHSASPTAASSHSASAAAASSPAPTAHGR